MQSEKGIEIDRVHPDSQAERVGLLSGDILVSVNSHKLRDPVDFMFYSTDDSVEIGLKRNGKNINLHVIREEGSEFGIDFKPQRPMTCKNNCIFCFVNQLPKGLRKSLYIKDDDYRMSFLYGNYVTLTNLRKEDKKRIVEQRLSPLYISVHATSKIIRNKLLGNAKAPDILKEIKFFTDNKIRFHAQIVLCPGYNDGKELDKTIHDLCSFYPYVSSIAVVPVGLTMHRRQNIKNVEKEEARDALRIVESFQKRYKKKHGDPIVYGADELYIKAEIPFPPLKDYGDFPQIENGVGMVPFFMNRVRKLRIPKLNLRKKRFLTFTGLSFYPFLKKFLKLLTEEGINVDLMPIENRFFGTPITVAGLLTGKDIIKTLFDRKGGQEVVLVPDVVLKEGEDMFLDNITLKDMEEALGLPIKRIESTPEGLIQGIAGKANET
jgi:putative radical SAM enzyme (TIGR03279 family)